MLSASAKQIRIQASSITAIKLCRLRCVVLEHVSIGAVGNALHDLLSARLVINRLYAVARAVWHLRFQS